MTMRNAVDSSALDTLIRFRCVRAEHLHGDGPERVFVHRSSWAYCAAGRTAPDHNLIPTGGLERRQLERGQHRG